jgi:menaquinone-specific isochorismate synthase
MAPLKDPLSLIDKPSDLAAFQSADLAMWERPSDERGARYRVVSLFAPAPHLDLLSFLWQGHGWERIYWSEPTSGQDSLTVAGIGVAAEVCVNPILDTEVRSAARPAHRFDEVESGISALFKGAIWRPADQLEGNDGHLPSLGHPARPRLLGGFAFHDDFIPDNTWATFKSAQFILPHYQLVRQGQDTYLTINALIEADEAITGHLADLREALLAMAAEVDDAAPTAASIVQDVRYPMSPQLWERIVKQATATIHEGRLEKVVLSRVCELRSDAILDAAMALGFLNAQYAESYRFLFEPTPHHAFVGATPELLVKKAGDQVTTMALAGSIGRGRDPEQDRALAEELMASPKERLEHQLVVEAIRENLGEVVDKVELPEAPVVLRLRNIQHLLTPISGTLNKPATSLIALVRRLHPTPALGGVPLAEALAFLRAGEPVPRGWYAGPVGWVDPCGDGAFVVAIRSAVTQHGRAWLYAGAGIVGESQPEREWAETALKFRPMLGALGVDGAKQNGSEFQSQ